MERRPELASRGELFIRPGESCAYTGESTATFGGMKPVIVAVGLLGDRVHVLCFTEAVDGIRVISFRKANAREVNRYAQVRPSDED